MTTPTVRRDASDTQPIPIVTADTRPRGRHAARPPRRGWLGWTLIGAREAGIVLGLAIVALLVLRLVVGISYVGDDAMEPTLAPGERIVVVPWGDPAAGDIVVVRAPEEWGTGGDAVVRVIALPGQRVACCTADGQVTVDGRPLAEPYLTGPTDQVDFDVVVPDERVFVLADRREAARDSRALLGSQAGTVSLDDVQGRVSVVAWPPRVLSQ